ncbi:hypothetical protein MCOR27_005677 [Pyricularia oryzae]|uniref:NADPH-dependent diflavin oxidoreductase 1 n=2 Tax=Pyricularia TaxID=48558 RepID=A0ABQ8NT26_PYRGI|nr:nitric oxide synthase [Pyricularia oryzae 70-15]KAH8839166.1 hypothetical protein MCOR01_008386 [Pyricularia oryzae]KAI6301619.1 hypothetical protein MCOR33_002898 [Pyricularia grisea]EHA54937.1 nitric oxide synthase [Pyricularia oryzae 70-15]KAH9439011.1 hypothetical protein MCOR02_002592 [Pyricularia oryzae]KAI6258100.1 hypothetical protein MCOR19_005492 [Pyricularia oryzae]
MESSSNDVQATDRNALVLYGSETGNAQDIAEDLGRAVERMRFKATVEEMNAVELKELLQYTVVIFVTSTTGQGDIPQNANRFWRSLLRRKLPPSCLSRLTFTSFGLGDSSYPKYNWAARKLSKRLVQLGAQSFFEAGEGDERHDDSIDTVYLPWKQSLRSHLMSHYPLPESIGPIPDDEPLPPRFVLSIDGTKGVTSSMSSTSSEDPPSTLLPIEEASEAIIQSTSRVTPTDHWQDVRLFSMDMDEPAEPLLPGATLIVYPKNFKTDVQALIDQMGWQDQADQPVHATKVPKELGWCTKLEVCTLRDLLTHGLDITAVPRRGFLEKLFFLTANAEQQERLKELIDPSGSQDFYDYTTRPRRTILEILGDFPSVKIPPSSAVDVFPVIRGREFSIANSPSRLAVPDEQITHNQPPQIRIEILAAMVEYRTIIRKPRVGLCSRYLKSLAAGARINIGIKQGSGMQRLLTRPVIAVATGTGIAPIRMLHQARAKATGSTPPGEMLLFFGCRSRKVDYYFADEWRRAANGLTVIPVFSRDADVLIDMAKTVQLGGQDEPPPTAGMPVPPSLSASTAGLDTSETGMLRRRDAGKNYVQHHIRRHAYKVAAMIRGGAAVCVCGSSGTMPKAVRLALEDALVAGGLCASAAEAQEYLTTRVEIWQETW